MIPTHGFAQLEVTVQVAREFPLLVSLPAVRRLNKMVSYRYHFILYSTQPMKLLTNLLIGPHNSYYHRLNKQ